MSNYDDFVHLAVMVFKVTGATWGLWLLGYVLVYSVQTLIGGPKQARGSKKPHPEARPVKSFWLEIRQDEKYQHATMGRR
jgi:hypothetical protein